MSRIIPLCVGGSGGGEEEPLVGELLCLSTSGGVTWLTQWPLADGTEDGEYVCLVSGTNGRISHESNLRALWHALAGGGDGQHRIEWDTPHLPRPPGMDRSVRYCS